MENIGTCRRMAAGIFVQGWFAVGGISLCAIAYAIREQRRLQFILAGPVMILLIYYWIVPESPRWLAARGRFKCAEKVLRRMAEVNGRELPDELHLEENRKEDDVVRIGRNPSLVDLFLTPNLRKKTLILFFICFSGTFVYYAFIYNIKEFTKNLYLLIFVSFAVEMPVFLLCVIAVNRFGRRWPVVIMFGISGFFGLMCMPFIGNPANAASLTAFSIMGKLVASSCVATVNVYSAELFPTIVRNVGIGTCFFLSSMAALLVQETNTSGAYPPIPMILCSALAFGSSFLSFFLPETNGHNLPETLTDGESFGVECMKKFMETGDYVRSFIIHREKREILNFGPSCSLRMGAFKLELLEQFPGSHGSNVALDGILDKEPKYAERQFMPSYS